MAIVLMHEHNITVQEAMDRIEKWYQQRTCEFVDAMSKIPVVQNKKVQADLRRYVWGLANWVTANWEWSFESGRFWKGMELDEEMKNAYDLVVELMPQKAAATPA
jgi:hypothetical protein